MLTIWFIDDNENFMEAMKKCLGIDVEKEYGIFNNRIRINFLDPDIDGTNIIKTIEQAGHDTSIIPDIIFLDLRYPVDKRNVMNIDENNEIIDPLKLSGINILNALKENECFDACFPIIFSEVSLNETNKNEIKTLFNYNSRELLFMKKHNNLSDIRLQINGLDRYVATKNCDSLKKIISKMDQS